ncbi:hypothetical protein KC341_g19 [Hortaea werneckii]|nr:hypothetical protein KC341_g19 [Hortaea werneckii]
MISDIDCAFATFVNILDEVANGLACRPKSCVSFPIGARVVGCKATPALSPGDIDEVDGSCLRRRAVGHGLSLNDPFFDERNVEDSITRVHNILPTAPRNISGFHRRLLPPSSCHHSSP